MSAIASTAVAAPPRNVATKLLSIGVPAAVVRFVEHARAHAERTERTGRAG